MTVDELIRLLEMYPKEAEVTVSSGPGRSSRIVGHSAVMERDGGELCQPCKATLLAGEAWESLDLDGGGLDVTNAESAGQAA